MTRNNINPAQAMSDDVMFEAIVKRQDERNARLIAMGEEAKRLNFESKFDERIGE